MKKLFLVTILSVMVLGAGCVKKEVKNNNTTSTQTPVVTEIPTSINTDGIDTSNWKTYKNMKYRFSFKYPDGVTVIEDGYYNNKVIYIEFDGTGYIFDFDLFIQNYEETPDKFDNEQILAPIAPYYATSKIELDKLKKENGFEKFKELQIGGIHDRGSLFYMNRMFIDNNLITFLKIIEYTSNNQIDINNIREKLPKKSLEQLDILDSIINSVRAIN